MHEGRRQFCSQKRARYPQVLFDSGGVFFSRDHLKKKKLRQSAAVSSFRSQFLKIYLGLDWQRSRNFASTLELAVHKFQTKGMKSFSAILKVSIIFCLPNHILFKGTNLLLFLLLFSFHSVFPSVLLVTNSASYQEYIMNLCTLGHTVLVRTTTSSEYRVLKLLFALSSKLKSALNFEVRNAVRALWSFDSPVLCWGRWTKKKPKLCESRSSALWTSWVDHETAGVRKVSAETWRGYRVHCWVFVLSFCRLFFMFCLLAFRVLTSDHKPTETDHIGSLVFQLGARRFYE